MHSSLWNSLEDLPAIWKHWSKRTIAHASGNSDEILQSLSTCLKLLEHVCPMHLSWLVMSYAALTFSIDPRIHRKDSDTFFQVCPPGVRFRVSINIIYIYIQIMFVSHCQEVQTAFVCNEPAGYLAWVRIKTHTQTIPSLNSELLLKWKEITLCFRETFRRASAMQASASAFCFRRRFWDHFASATAAKYIPATMANIPATQTEHGS